MSTRPLVRFSPDHYLTSVSACGDEGVLDWMVVERGEFLVGIEESGGRHRIGDVPFD